MKHYVVDLIANGATQDWTVVGGVSAWQACLRGSGDSTYIHTDTVGNISSFVCADASLQREGFISAISFHVRARLAGGLPFFPPQVNCSIDCTGGVILAGMLMPSGAGWTDWCFRATRNGAARFTAADIASLEVIVNFVASPPGCQWDISEIWLDAEYCDTLEYYDPVTFPDIPSGVGLPLYLMWTSNGDPIAAIDGATGLLAIDDASAVQYRRFYRDAALAGALTYAADMRSEICQRVSTTAVVGTIDGCVYRVAILNDGTHSVCLMIVRSGGVDYLGLISDGLDVDDFSKYYDTTPLTGLATGVSRHFRLLVDRRSSVGQVQVFIDYDDTPALQYQYDYFGATTTKKLEFGTGDLTHQSNQVTVLVDFISWQHWQAYGPRFRDWQPAFSEVNRVSIDTADSYIARPVALPYPYPAGQRVGQSDYCCSLTVADNTEYSWAKQTWWLPTGYSSCNLAVTYRMDVIGVVAEFLIQRTDDHTYWNQAGLNWLSMHTPVTMPNSLLRTTQVIATGVTPTVGKGIVVWIRPVLGTGLGNIKLYHVQLIPMV